MKPWTRRRFLRALPALPLAGAMSRASGAEGKLRAGAAKVNITLPLGVNNGGVILRGGPATQIHDELHAREHHERAGHPQQRPHAREQLSRGRGRFSAW